MTASMTPVGEVFLAIFLTLVAFAAFIAFCHYFCKNTPVTCTSKFRGSLARVALRAPSVRLTVRCRR